MAFSRPGLRNIMPSTFLFHVGFTFFTTFFAITLANKFNFTQGQIGDFFAYQGIMIIFAQGVIVRKVSAYVKDYQVLRFSIFGTACCLMAFFWVSREHMHMLYFIPPFLATFNALTFAFTASLVTRVTPENIRGEGLGISSSVMALAQAIPACLSGYVATIYPTLPILVGSLTIILGGVSFWIFFKPKQC